MSWQFEDELETRLSKTHPGKAHSGKTHPGKETRSRKEACPHEEPRLSGTRSIRVLRKPRQGASPALNIPDPEHSSPLTFQILSTSGVRATRRSAPYLGPLPLGPLYPEPLRLGSLSFGRSMSDLASDTAGRHWTEIGKELPGRQSTFSGVFSRTTRREDHRAQEPTGENR
mgnify:CR=1 FL=1